MAKSTIDFKDQLRIMAWMDAALKKEKEKYKKCPVTPDYVAGQEAAQGWGYVVAGYFLLEQSLKALLYVRNKQSAPNTLVVDTLRKVRSERQDGHPGVLCRLQGDNRRNHVGQYPFEDLDSFLTNLDGDKNQYGTHLGSFDWRYFLIEEQRSEDNAVGQCRLHARSSVRVYVVSSNARWLAMGTHRVSRVACVCERIANASTATGSLSE